MSQAAARRCRSADDILPPVPSADPARLGRIVVHRDPAAARDAWERLEAEAAISPYQTWAWLSAWLETRGRTAGVEPFIVIAYDKEGEPLVLLPLGVRRHGFVTVGTFLGERDSNFNLGLFRPGPQWTRACVEKLLRGAAKAGRTPVDLFILHNQPHQWEGLANPLALLPNQPSPSFGYKVALMRDADQFFKATLSKDSRKKLRRKAERLADHGAVEHRVARTPEEARAVIRAFETQRIARCAMLGLGTADVPDLVAFLTRSSIVGTDNPAVELHAFHCGTQILATFGGTVLRGRFCGMIISFDPVSDLSRFSPGDLLVAAIVRAKCREGIAVFDLGIGEARYKEAYCPEPEPLFETLLTLSPRGRLFAAVEAMRLQVKRSIKQSAWAWPTVRALRRQFGGARPGSR
ncbi:MAG TPA: GNAT family N-acetyltransferase [Lichenihabitans sp.]|jgi:CelD/BcsL family acetyltransferase involved in cellulose biosynthesis|nr:GNAT family N-acetyltransferase [Lichenihabitans sp.]